MTAELRKIINCVSSALVAAVVLLAAALVGVRITGLKVFTVLSGSMEPEYPVGSLIYVKSTSPESLEVGDVITFRISGGLAATHRIYSISSDGEEPSFITKGDANDSPDASPVKEADIIGTPVLTIPYLGYLSVFIKTKPGMYYSIAFCVFVFALLFVPDGKDKKKGTETVD